VLPSRHHDVSRLEAFSDAAFAFALTLLVISLEVPRSYADLIRTMYGLPSFAWCFALLVWIWQEHNRFFRRYDSNAGLLFITLFYVYPLQFMFDSMFAELGAVRGLQRSSLVELSRVSAIYGLGFLAVFLMFALLDRRPDQQQERLQLTATCSTSSPHAPSSASARAWVCCVLSPRSCCHRRWPRWRRSRSR
jgi:uncharacterized membrane protein